MKLTNIYIIESVNIVPWDEMADDFDPWITADQADKIAVESGIRISRNKELEYIAIDDKENVVGALWLDRRFEDDVTTYDFDVAVSKTNRNARVGLDLIETILGDYNNDPEEMKTIEVWVVNPKLVRVLERKYNFEITSQYRDGSATMAFSG